MTFNLRVLVFFFSFLFLYSAPFFIFSASISVFYSLRGACAVIYTDSLYCTLAELLMAFSSPPPPAEAPCSCFSRRVPKTMKPSLINGLPKLSCALKRKCTADRRHIFQAFSQSLQRNSSNIVGSKRALGKKETSH